MKGRVKLAAAVVVTVWLIGHKGEAGTVPANASQAAWARAQLAAIGASPSQADIASLAAWADRESPWDHSAPDGAMTTHNPLNTTDQGGATGEVNGIGVAVYPDWSTGIAATARTLSGYPQIMTRLISGRGLCGWASPEFTRWSGGGYDGVC